MRANLYEYHIQSPKTLSEALNLLAQKPGELTPFAGGTDLMVLFEAGLLKQRSFLNLWNLADLRQIQVESDSISIGALTTFSQIQSHPILRKEFPNLCQASQETGAISIQNRGTLGGNIANASPAADSPPALLTYDAEVELISNHGNRWIDYSEFHIGYKQTQLRPNELISSVRIPRKKGLKTHYYRKVGTRKAQAISKVCFSGVAAIESQTFQEVRIALGSIAPTPFRCVKTEAILKGKQLDDSFVQYLSAAKAQLVQEIKPIDDIRSTSIYRLRVAENLLEEFAQTIFKRNLDDLRSIQSNPSRKAKSLSGQAAKDVELDQ